MALAAAGAVAVVCGVALIYVPAGLICAGLEAVGGAYLIAYFGAGRKQ